MLGRRRLNALPEPSSPAMEAVLLTPLSSVHQRARRLRSAASATRVSGSAPQRSWLAPLRPSFPRVAQRSLCALLAFMSQACLVPSTTEFTEPDQTPPFLVGSSADPDIREFLVVVDS